MNLRNLFTAAFIATAVILLCSGKAVAGYTNVFNPATGHYYALTLQTGPFLDARTEAQNTGNELTTVNDAAENDWIYDTFSSVAANAGARLWVGLSDEITEGVFLWDNGEPVTFTNWDPVTSEPNGGTGENYTEIITTGGLSSQRLWNDNGNLAPNFGVIESDHLIFEPEPSTCVLAMLGVFVVAIQRLGRVRDV